MAIPVLRSLTLKQAIHAVLAAFVIGLTITAAEFAWTATRERAAALAQVKDVVALVEGPAASAAWLIDAELAGQVLQGMVRTNAAWAEIRLSDGTLLARRERPPKPASLLERGATALLFVDRPVVTHELMPRRTDWRADHGPPTARGSDNWLSASTPDGPPPASSPMFPRRWWRGPCATC